MISVAGFFALIVGLITPTTVSVFHGDASSPRLPRRCMRSTPLRHGHVTAVVRTGPVLRSVTVVRVGDAYVYGCDATAGRWCNAEAGRIRRARVIDPRLGLLCRTSDHRVVATAWINPARSARTIVVDGGRGHRDAYPVAARLPVRVATTTRIRYGRAEATFVVAQLDRRGRPLRQERIVAHVSG